MKERTTTNPKCSICNDDYDESCGGIQGLFGVMPVTFCEWCFSSIYDMVEQDIRDNVREEMAEEDREDIKTVLNTVGIDYETVEKAYRTKQRFFNFRFDEPCGMSHK